ncbi:MAG: DUF1232 domain-containing protein [Candidatus Nitronauta litoralis]|uniref:DUF1232 domain-containing protein n=1 Tax=Candidatus Nitronauta litoralis TaxID=2705533 RepID=A0A7T0BVZ6_9BACT|nr:MAG: DUF1232 domain-containing protein [Candidatus Nitronauta litoralis]
MKSFLVAMAGLVSLIYLVNPGAGIIEIIPDNMPIIGNLDEGTAAAVLLAALRYYGVDLTGFLRKGIKEPDEKDSPENDRK